ncbi:MAG: methylated-DNA--[protein]-cysteine S-methyltransferase [Bacteroidales bacterium]|nr:methylated-DNA--[protein]-cysteine S-methyltransferase [Bacteroidales bacterium]
MKSPVGNIAATVSAHGLQELKQTSETLKPPKTPFGREVRDQLKNYFARKNPRFDFELDLQGTDFQKKVWNELRKIPYGSMVSYGYIAQRIGKPKAARAVGSANHNNPLWIVVPCHRVVSSNGKLTGYAGGLEMKAYLLQLEGALLV